MAATYTVKQVAEILGYSTNSIYTFLKEKRIAGVRVGKGRFRIPQSELDRLLLSSKKQTSTVVPPPTPRISRSSQMPAAGVADVTGSAVIERTKLLGVAQLGTLNIFDWFIGTGAVVSGLGLFLFNSSLSFFPLESASPILSVMRAVLIGAGIGILVTNLTGQTHIFWHKLFHILLAALGATLAVFFLVQGDFDGAMIYGPLAVVVFTSSFLRIGGVAWMSVYLSLLTVATNIMVLLAGKSLRITALLSASPFSWGSAVAIVATISVLVLFALWWGYFRSKQLFWFATWLAAFWYFAVAFWYASDMYWSRSFFFLVIGMTCLYLSPWEWLASIRSRRADLFTLGVFGTVFAILLAGIAAVYIMQTNGMETVKRENVYKVEYAKHDIEETITSVLATLTGARDNTVFIEAVEKKDFDALNNSERIMFESNHAIRRLVLLDADGHGINLYPFGTFDQPDLSFRDYFIHSRDVGTPYVTDVFVALVDQSHRPVVSVASPLYNKNRAFIGVLVASLDLDGMSAKLQKIAVPERNEYIMVVDSKGKRMIHPEVKLMGAQTEPNNPVLLAAQGKSGVTVGPMFDGGRAVIAYQPIESFGVHWGISIISPLTKIYRLSDASNLSLFSVIVAAVLLAACILQGGFFYRWKVHMSGGSP